MKKINIAFFMAAIILGTSCKKYLDINDNPNKATSATPALLLPQALATTASNLNGYNSYGAQLVGYQANAGGFGSFGTSITYNYSSSDNSGRWTTVYDNLEDYQTMMEGTVGKPELGYFEAVARIMKVLNFQLLVDTYNDIPYFDALQGANKLTPSYTDAKVIYKDLADQLDTAIATINNGVNVVGIAPLGTSDVMFKGSTTKWKQFANTLKLRILVRGNGKITFTNSNFDDAGFLDGDALINPGYKVDNGRQNPKWNSWGYSYTGASGNKAWLPNTFVLAFYNGTKLSDPGRGAAIYYQFPSTPSNRLGVESSSLSSSPEGSYWYPGKNRNGKSPSDTTGVLKGPGAGMPVITAAESHFLQSEAIVKGILSAGSAKTEFENGITASFKYLYTLPNLSISGNPVADAATYLTENSSSPLVNFTKASSTDEKIEAIITQKYIALNMVNSEEAWNEYRRTHYPTIINTPNASGTETFASSVSQSTRPDRLPTRILYPTTEGTYNSANVPKGITPFASTIFWAL